MKWPRGRYNGLRITGFTVTLSFDVYPWWRPRMSWNFGQPYFLWLFFCIRLEAKYIRECLVQPLSQPKQRTAE